MWGARGAGQGSFDYPYGLGIDPHGNVFVTDMGNDNLVQEFGVRPIAVARSSWTEIKKLFMVLENQP